MSGAAERDTALDRLIRPASVAIVGASERTGASSGFVIRNLLERGYAGRIVPVHRTAATIFGLQAVPSLADMDSTPDAVLIGLPAEAVAGVLEEAASLGVKAAVVLASGFAETGAEGRARQEIIREIALRHGMAVCGPNCLGLFENRSGLALYSSRLAPIRQGSVAVLSHSGALGIALAHSGRIGVSLLVSAGNAAITDMPDYLRYLAHDDATRVALLVIEKIDDPAAFAEAVAAMHGVGKRVIVLRAGRSERGAVASAAHTGALAGSDAAFLAFFERIGVIAAEDIATALEIAALMSSRAASLAVGRAGQGVALLGVSGGGMAHVTDIADAIGMDVPALAPATVQALRAILPAYATPQNPLDLTGIVFGQPAIYGAALAALAEDPSIGAIAAVQDVPSGLDQDGAAEYEGIAHAIATFAGSAAIPCIVLSNLPRVHADFEHALEVADVPVLLGTRAGLLALKALLTPPQIAATPVAPSVATLPHWVERIGAGPLTEREAKLFLAEHGLPTTREGLATTADEAVAIAVDLGFPVVLKIESADIGHKTEAGGVRLGLADEAAVRLAFAEIVETVRARAARARIAGVLVQEMIQGGVEAIVGIVRHETFGPVIVVGTGGVLVELVRDSSVGILPLDEAGARELLSRTRLRSLLQGWRGAPPCDVDALISLMVRVAGIAFAYRDVVSAMDLNPVVVLPQGRGVRILDALVLRANAVDAS